MSANITLPDRLSATTDATLPARYEAAKYALAECSRMDECQAWANKAEALASYAKQAEDDTLRKHADRIQARAIRRAQELLAQFPEGTGGDRQSKKHLDGADEMVTRRQAAKDAGLSDRQYRTAMEVGHVPEQQFEAQVESDNPPTVTALAKQGRATRKPAMADHLHGRDPSDYYNATHAAGALHRMTKATADYPAESVARGLSEAERDTIRAEIQKVDAWLDALITRI